jgi:hypothetical protein
MIREHEKRSTLTDVEYINRYISEGELVREP